MRLTLWFILILLISSCRKNEPTNWDVQVLAPVVNSTLTLNNLLPDSTLQVNPDNSVNLVYDASIYKVNVEDLVELNDTSIEEALTIPLSSITANPGATFLNNVENIAYNGIDVDLYELILREGYIDYSISSRLTETTIYTYSIPSATLNGNPFELEVTVPPGTPGNPSLVSGTADLSDYHMDLTGVNGNESNTIQTQLSVKVDPNGSPITVTNNDTLYVSNTFRGIQPHYARGYFGQRTENESSIGEDFPAFAKITDGTLDIDQLNVDLILTNGIGVDGRVVINNLESINSGTGNTVQLSHSSIANPINLNRAVETGNSFTPSDYTIQMDEGNSNIDLFLENLPDQLGYDLSLEINPLGNVSNGNDFIFYTSLLDVKLRANLPLSLIANNLTLQDTLDISVQQDPEANATVKYGKVTLIVDNGYPLNASIDLLLMNANGNITDTIPADQNQWIQSAVVDGNNVVLNSSNTVLNYTLSEPQVNTLMASDQMTLRVAFTTASITNHVDIYSDYQMDIQTTVNVKTNLSLP